jgi:peroxiredoxin
VPALLEKAACMRRSALILTLTLLSFVTVLGEISTIRGRVIHGSGFTIRLMNYSDQVSYLRETAGSMTIGEDELFSFTIDHQQVLYCWLDIEFQQAELFLRPGQSYEIEINLKDQPLSMSYYNRNSLDYAIIRDDSSHLNLSIQDFNQLYNDFLLNYTGNIRSRSSKVEYETFMKAIGLRFQNVADEYFKNYIRYKSASMQLFMRLKSRENIGLEYIAGQSVLYDHLEYMDFFHLYFEKYFISGGKYFNYSKTYDLVNGTASAADILDSLKIDPVLKDQAVRELLLLDGLKDLYSVSGFKHERVMALVKEMAAGSHSGESRDLAGNLLNRFKRLQPGTPAPDFLVKDVTFKKDYQLADFSGKKLYLAFFESGNPACQSELGLITDLYEEYKMKVSFVAVSVDKDSGKLLEYIKMAGLPWLFTHYSGSLDLLENYDAIAFPHFVLIDENGKVIRCPAPSPSENIRKLFDSF